MYEDFYSYIPGSLDAKQCMRKLRFKRFCYVCGALVVFSCGFILGLAWYEPNAALTQIASPPQPTMETTSTPRVETVTPPELVVPNAKPLLTTPSEPISPRPVDELTDRETETERNVAKAVVSPMPSATPDVEAAASPPRRPERAPVDKPAKITSQSKTPKSPKRAQSQRPYLVQIGAFRNEANAQSIVAKFSDKGYQPFIRTVKDRQNRTLYRVFLDRAKDKAQAQATAKAFEETEKMDALVMLADNLASSRPQAHRRDAASR